MPQGLCTHFHCVHEACHLTLLTSSQFQVLRGCLKAFLDCSWTDQSPSAVSPGHFVALLHRSHFKLSCIFICLFSIPPMRLSLMEASQCPWANAVITTQMMISSYHEYNLQSEGKVHGGCGEQPNRPRLWLSTERGSSSSTAVS